LKPDKKVLVKDLGQALECWDRGEGGSQIETPGGRIHVRWDEKGSATALRQLGFFVEFLEETWLFERWVKSCPLSKPERWIALVRYIIAQSLANKPGNPFLLTLHTQPITADSG
jgi:hypothetical protein